MIFTCSYSEVPKNFDGLLVQISDTKPKNFFVHKKIEQLVPDPKELIRYKNAEKKAKNELEKTKNELIYAQNYLEKIKQYNPQQLIDYFNKASEKTKKDILLLCYEKHDQFCHRNIFADYINSSLGQKIIQDYPTYLKQKKFISDIKMIISVFEQDEEFANNSNYKSMIFYLRNLIFPLYNSYNTKSPFIKFSFSLEDENFNLKPKENDYFTILYSFIVDLTDKKENMKMRARFYYDCINSLISDMNFDVNTETEFEGQKYSFISLLEAIDSIIKKEKIYKELQPEHEKILVLARQHIKAPLENLEMFV